MVAKTRSHSQLIAAVSIPTFQICVCEHIFTVCVNYNDGKTWDLSTLIFTANFMDIDMSF